MTVLDLVEAPLAMPARGVFSTRTGGHSTPPWHALNLALHVEDDAAHVAANRQQLSAAIGGLPVAWAEQVHGCDVAVVNAPGRSARVDALVTTTPGLALAVQAADCLPVLFADPVSGVVGAAHGGRQGLVLGVLQETVRVMAELGAEPSRTTAVLGPCVCGACYELPEKLADEVGAAVPGSRGTTRAGTPSVDLAAGAERQLAALGVQAVRAGGCTVEQPDRFFSFRRDARTGRHAGLVWLA